MSDYNILRVFTNPVFVPALLCWLVSQLIKVILTWKNQSRIDRSRFFGPGGMPSSHVASTMAVATSVGLQEGFHSSLFGVALVFTLVVTYDAVNVRRAAGEQAYALNRIIENLFSENGFTHKKLKELLGHKPIEVLAGGALGIVIAVLYYFVFTK